MAYLILHAKKRSLGAGALGHGLSVLGRSMRCQITGQQSDSRISVLLLVDWFRNVTHKRVPDGDSLGGDAGIEGRPDAA